MRGSAPRTIRAAMALHFARRMGPPLLAVAAYTAVAGALVHWDMTRMHEPHGDWVETLYATWTQLFFEPTAALPRAPVARALFWITPIVGVVLIAEGLLKVGGPLLDAKARHEIWVRIMAEHMRSHIVVCGLGHVGYRVVEELRALGEPLVAIERHEGEFLETVRGFGIPVIVGDARRDELLVEAGIERARAVVCATNDDLANLEIALDAKRMNKGVRVVLRMFDQSLAKKIGGALELDETFSTSAVSAPLIALKALDPGVRSAYKLSDGSTRITAELIAGPAFARTTVATLEAAIPARVVGVRVPPSESFVTPRGDSPVGPGDVLLLDTRSVDIDAVRDVVIRR